MVAQRNRVAAAVRRDLRRLPDAERTGALAASALALAKFLDESAADDAVAATARELRATMTELLKAAPAAKSGIDDLRARRAARAAG